MGAAALLAVGLPALPAFAATSTATLVKGVSTLPGAARPYEISVANPAGSLLSQSKPINLVQITLPNSIGLKVSADPITPPSGWTVSRKAAGSVQTYLFKTATATSPDAIQPGASKSFAFPADVSAPVNSDRTGKFIVTSSNDYGAADSAAATGSLDTAVRALEVVTEGLAATSPLGVVDGTGTSGQAISYRTRIKNYAQQELMVTPSLASNSGDAVGAPAPTLAKVPGLGGTADVVFPVTLAAGQTADKVVTFTAGATVGTGSSATATAGNATATFTRQAPATLAFALADLDPRAVRLKDSYDFVLTARKGGTPKLVGMTGGLKVDSTGRAIDTALKSTTGLDVSNVGGALSDAKLLFETTQLKAGVADGVLNAVVGLTGTDDNGYSYDLSRTLTNAVTVDNTIPLPAVNVTLPSDGNVVQTAAKDGDRLNIAGQLSTDKSDTDRSCAGLVLTKLELVTTSATGAMTTTPVTGATSSGCSFTAATTPTFGVQDGTFLVRATVSDVAKNANIGDSPTFRVDNIAPALTKVRTLDATHVLVRFDDQGLVRGGCDSRQYMVDGEPFVSTVTFSDGSSCLGKMNTAGKDNDRILTLTQARSDQDYAVNVTYTPGTGVGSDPVKDAAAAAAAKAKVLSEVGIAPLAPVLTTINREGGAETATGYAQDGTTVYYVRTGGEKDVSATFTGGRAGYRIEVVDPDAPATVLKSLTLTSSDPATIAVPVGTSEGRFKRALRLVNGTEIASQLTAFAVEVDLTNPSLTLSSLSGRTMSVTFNEPIVGGSESPINWFGLAVDPAADPADQDQRDRVSPATAVSGSGNVRTITLADDLSGLMYSGAQYVRQDDSFARYVDRSGRQLADNTRPVK